jgi:hypothetical protein
MFGPEYPRDHQVRVERLRQLERGGESGQQWDPFYDLDERFFSVARVSTFDAHADAFVRAHMDLFFRNTEHAA